MRSLVFDSIWAFQPIVDVLRPQSHGVGRALLGMSSPTPRGYIRLSLSSRQLVNLLPVAQRTNALAYGVVERTWAAGREFESHVHHENAF